MLAITKKIYYPQHISHGFLYKQGNMGLRIGWGGREGDAILVPEVCFHGNAKEKVMEKGVAEFKRTLDHEANEVGCYNCIAN